MSSVSSALAKNSVLQIGGKIFGTLFGLVTFYFLLHFYGTTGYGYLTTALTYVSLFAIIVDFGLTLTTSQMISEHGADEEKILGNLLTLRLITALAFMALAPITALFIPSIDRVFILVAIASGSSFLASVSQTFIGVFQKRLRLTLPVLAETLNRLTALAIIVVTGFTHPSIAFAALGFFFGAIVQFLITLGGTASLVRLRPAIDFSVWREILIRSWPIGLSIFFNLLYLKGDIFFMSIFNIPADIIGQYGSAYKVVDVITMIPVTFMGLMLPLLTNAWSKKSSGQFTKHLQNTFDIFSLIAIPFALGSILLGVKLMTFVKPELILAGQLLAVLGPAAAIVFFNSLYGHTIVAVGKQRVMTWSYMFVALLAIIGYVVFIPLYTVWAAAWVTIAAESTIGLLAFMVVYTATHVWPSLRMFGRSLVGSLVMAAAILFVPLPHVLLSILLGVIVYSIVVMALGGPKPKTLLKLFLPDEAPPTGP